MITWKLILISVFPFCFGDDMCSVPGACSQYCIPHNDTFSCNCGQGYIIDPLHPTRCKVEKGELLLFISDFTNIYKYSPTRKNHTLVFHNPTGVVMVDYDMYSNILFWTDTQERKIYRSELTENLDATSTNSTTVVSDGIAESNGLAIDWIYKKIYWTDYTLRTIQLTNFDGRMRKTIYADNSDKPRAISVDPIEGWIFWSNWGAFPKLMRSGFDGGNRQAIVQENLIWPNDITLDLEMKQIYWIDSKLKTLSSCDYDGSSRRQVIESDWIVSHPFAITMFEDKIYWTDWIRKVMFEADKFSGYEFCTHSISGISRPRSIEAYHSSRQPRGHNHCGVSNGHCSHLCFPTPRLKNSTLMFICSCPDGMELLSDHRTCRESVETSSTYFRTQASVTRVTTGSPTTTTRRHTTLVTITPKPISDTTKDEELHSDELKQDVRIIVPKQEVSEQVEHYDETVSPVSSELHNKLSTPTGSIKSSGAIIGIVIGVLFIIITLTGMIVFLLYRRSSKRIPKNLLEADYCAELEDSNVTWTTSFNSSSRR